MQPIQSATNGAHSEDIAQLQSLLELRDQRLEDAQTEIQALRGEIRDLKFQVCSLVV